jgi:hypothetical protein
MGSNGDAREEYLVRGAYLACEYGTHHRRLNLPRSHGVYIKDKEHCLMNAADCKPGEGQGYNIPPFGICQAPDFPRGGKETILLKTETVNPLTGETYRDVNGRTMKFEDNVKGCRCEAIFENNMWQNTHSKTLVCLKGETPYPALTTGSFLYCKYGGHVYPINSGQPDLDPPKADATLLALTQETEIKPELIPLAQGASAALNSATNAALLLIRGGKISVGKNTINTVYCDAKTGELYVDLYEATAAFGGKYMPEMPFDLSFGVKNIFNNPFINFSKDRSGKIISSNGDLYMEFTLSSADGNATATRYTADGKYAFAMFSSGYFQQDGKHLVKFDYVQKSMDSLGWGTDNNTPKEITKSQQVVDAVASRINNADVQTKKEYIWNYLQEHLGTSDTHTAAIMGNMQQESNFSQTNAQDFAYPGLDNPEYIDKYSAKDGVGWGLLQWTYHTRKQGLLDYANENGASVGDITTQLEWLAYEVNNVSPYKSNFKKFLQQPDIESATKYFCENIEQAGTPEMDSRIKYAKSILDEFG